MKQGREGKVAFEDFRKFIEALDRTGDVVCIKQEVGWDLEVGTFRRVSIAMGLDPETPVKNYMRSTSAGLTNQLSL